MPTGYTSIIDDFEDATFEEYAWRCARNFGALIDMREEPMDARVPPRAKILDYYTKKLAEAEVERRRLETLTDEEVIDEWLRKETEVVAERRRWRAKSIEIFNRYEEMRKKVEAWEPPSAAHKDFKKFMLEQLKTGAPYVEQVEAKMRPTPSAGAIRRQWLLENAEDLRRFADKHREEVLSVNNRNDWVDELRKSLGPQPAARSK